MIELTEDNNKLQREANRAKEQASFQYQQIIDQKDQEISKLQNIVYQQTSEQGQKLLDALKTGQPVAQSKPTVSLLDEAKSTERSDNSSAVTTTNQTDASINNSSNGIASMEDQIKQLQEKLRFANETIATLVDKDEKEDGKEEDNGAKFEV